MIPSRLRDQLSNDIVCLCNHIERTYIYIYIVPVESSCRAKRVEMDTVLLDRKPDMITLAKLHVLGSYPRPDDKQRGNHGFVSAKMVMECVLVMILCIGVCALFSICLIYIFNTCCPIIVLAAFGASFHERLRQVLPQIFLCFDLALNIKCGKPNCCMFVRCFCLSYPTAMERVRESPQI